MYLPPHLPVLDPCPVPDDNRESTEGYERHAAFRNGRRICRYMTAIRAALHCKETATSSRCLICAHRHDVGQSGYSTIDHGGSTETLGNDHPAVFDNLEGHVEPAGDMGRHPPPPRTWLPRSGIRPGRPASAPSPAWSGVRCGCRLTRRLRLFSFFLLAPMEAASDTSFRHIFFKIYCGWSDAIHSKKRSTMVTQMKQTPWTMQMNEKAKKRRVAYRPRSRASRRTHSVTTDHGSPSAWTGVAVTSSWSIGCTRGVC